MIKKPTALVILDGWGYSPSQVCNAIYQAHPKNFNLWFQEFPHSILGASGKFVGLKDGMIGNSAVGHLTIGAGRVIEQPVTILDKSMQDKTFFKSPILVRRFEQLKKSGKKLHIMGLLSDAGVHSDCAVLFALLRMAADHKIADIIVHPFLDGRDVPPQSAEKYLQQLDKVLAEIGYGSIGSLHGRFYAMDRDENWDRTLKSFTVLTENNNDNFSSPASYFDRLNMSGLSKSRKSHSNQNVPSPLILSEVDLSGVALAETEGLSGVKNWQEILQKNYSNNITDEFIEPVRLHPEAYIQPDEAVIFFNTRADRARQLTALLLNAPTNNLREFKFDQKKEHKLCPHTKAPQTQFFITAIQYLPSFKTDVLVEKKVVNNTLFDIFEKNKITIFTIAESEKYAHVTYFFNGGKEITRPNEIRVIVPSIPEKNYSTNPKMSAPEITKKVIDSLKTDPQDFYLINYANADMVGHSGDFTATREAVQCLDQELKKLYDVLVGELDGTLYITGDHGNAEEKCYPDGSPRTSHTTNSVPFLVINKNFKQEKLSLSGLADIAPFILKEMGLLIPNEMKKNR